MITDDVRAMHSALAADPMDWLSRMALADALAEAGEQDESGLVRAVAQCVREGAIAPERLSERGRLWLADVRKAHGCRGRKTRVVVATSVVPHDLQWGGGSRNEFTSCGLTDAHDVQIQRHGPWREGIAADVPTGWPIVEHSFFQGKDCGLRVYVHPSDVAYLIS